MPLRRRSLFALAILVASTAPARCGPSLMALDESGVLLVFDAEQPATVRQLQPKVRTRLIGLDVRPADGRLYAVAVSNDLYRIDPATGAAELVATLTVPF